MVYNYLLFKILLIFALLYRNTLSVICPSYTDPNYGSVNTTTLTCFGTGICVRASSCNITTSVCGEKFVISSINSSFDSFCYCYNCYDSPTIDPTLIPTTLNPSVLPITLSPSYCPSTSQPSPQPSTNPSKVPSREPSSQPTIDPSSRPSFQPSEKPAKISPSSQPSKYPSIIPSVKPTNQPEKNPTRKPSNHPSTKPLVLPSRSPSIQPSSHPSHMPSHQPSSLPSNQPILKPSTHMPSQQPIIHPSSQPSQQPSNQPTFKPTKYNQNILYFEKFYNGGWRQATLPKNSYVDIVGAACWSKTNYLVLGNQGQYSLIFQSVDVGTTWNTKFSVFTETDDLTNEVVTGRLFDIACCASNGICLSVSETGQIYQSLEDGINWSQIDQLSISMSSVSIGLNGRAFVVGTSITLNLASIYYSDPSSYGYLKWIQSNLGGNNLVPLNAISSKNGIHVVAVGAGGIIYRSIDGGVNWTYQILSLCDFVDLYSVSYSFDLTVIAGGDNGCLIKSNDYGKTWIKLSNLHYFDSLSFMYHSLSLVSNKIAYVTGTYYDNSPGRIFRTYDGGITWAIDYSVPQRYFTSLSMLNYDIGIVGALSDSSGRNNIYVRSSNPTKNPTSFPSSQPSEMPIELPSVKPSNQPFLKPSERPTKQPSNNPSSKPTTSKPTSMPTGLIPYGDWFEEQSIAQLASNTIYYRSASWISRKNIVIVGGSRKPNLLLGGVILYSSDYGAPGTWKIGLSNVKVLYQDIDHFVSSTAIFCVAIDNKGNVSVSIDSGITWPVVLNLSPITLNALTIQKETGIAWCVGSNRIYRSSYLSNYKIWNMITVEWRFLSVQSSTILLYGINFFNDTHFVVVGKNKFIANCYDQNSTIFISCSQVNSKHINASSNSLLFAVSVGNKKTAMLTSNFGDILKTENGGLSWVKLPNIKSTSSSIPQWSGVGNGVYGPIIHLLSSSVAYLINTKGNIYNTQNGGLSWTLESRLGENSSLSLFIKMESKNIGIVGGSIDNIYMKIPLPSSTPSRQPSSQPSNPSTQPTSQPIKCPYRKPSFQPSCEPSNQPANKPSQHPSSQLIKFPSLNPTCQPTSKPSLIPSRAPLKNPSCKPSTRPNPTPTQQPNYGKPSTQPSLIPYNCFPSKQPSSYPTMYPTYQPYVSPSMHPFIAPTRQPFTKPSSQPSFSPNIEPSCQPIFEVPSLQPSSQPSLKPSTQPLNKPSLKPSQHPTLQPINIPSLKPSSSPTNLPNVQPSKSPFNQPSLKPSTEPSMLPFIKPSAQPFDKPSKQPVREPSSQPIYQPSLQPFHQPSMLPSSQPSYQPVENPIYHHSEQPSEKPSAQTTTIPSYQPTISPSNSPSLQPFSQPILPPSLQPSLKPTVLPSIHPTQLPSSQPYLQPQLQPSYQPTSQPSYKPNTQPSYPPATQPSQLPSRQPVISPTKQPDISPIYNPSGSPTDNPSRFPILQPTNQPTKQPIKMPSLRPSKQPSCSPYRQPSFQPRRLPSSLPTIQPSKQPVSKPSRFPSLQPILHPTSFPSRRPSVQPSAQPFKTPSKQPIRKPSSQPSLQPFLPPSQQPSSKPSSQPTKQPIRRPSKQPFCMPSTQPTCQPFKKPTNQPSSNPSKQSSAQPSVQPLSQPSYQSSVRPSSQPSHQSSRVPTAIPTFDPTSCPTNQISKIPTSKPSSKPSLIPTLFSLLPSSFPSFESSQSLISLIPTYEPFLNAIPTSLPIEQNSLKYGFNVTQYLAGVTVDEVRNDSTSMMVFKLALAYLITGVSITNINIISLKNKETKNFTNVMKFKYLTKKYLDVSPDKAITINYSISYMVGTEEIFKNATYGYSTIVSYLEEYQHTKAADFTNTLHQYAMLLNSSIMMNALIRDTDNLVVTNFFPMFIASSRPTLSPTSNGNFSINFLYKQLQHLLNINYKEISSSKLVYYDVRTSTDFQSQQYCQSWNSFRINNLFHSYQTKLISKILLEIYQPYTNSNTSAVCSDSNKASNIVSLLVSTAYTNTTNINCNSNSWVIKDCQNNSSFISRALCVNCLDPCEFSSDVLYPCRDNQYLVDVKASNIQILTVNLSSNNSNYFIAFFFFISLWFLSICLFIYYHLRRNVKLGKSSIDSYKSLIISNSHLTILCGNLFDPPDRSSTMKSFQERLFLSDITSATSQRFLLVEDIFKFSCKVFSSFVLILIFTLLFNTFNLPDDGSCSMKTSSETCLNSNQKPTCVWFNNPAVGIINHCSWANHTLDTYSTLRLIILTLAIFLLIRTISITKILHNYFYLNAELKSIFQLEYPKIHFNHQMIHKKFINKIDSMTIIDDTSFSTSSENKSNNNFFNRGSKTHIHSYTRLSQVYDQYRCSLDENASKLLDDEWKNFNDDNSLLHKFTYNLQIKQKRYDGLSINNIRDTTYIEKYMHQKIDMVNQFTDQLKEGLSFISKEKENDIALNTLLIFYFMVDLIGIRTKEAIIFSRVVNKNIMSLFMKNQNCLRHVFFKIISSFLLICGSIVIMLYCINTIGNNTQNIQWNWLIAVGCMVIFEIVILQLIESTWEYIIIPLSIQQNVIKIKSEINHLHKKASNEYKSQVLREGDLSINYSSFFISYNLSLLFNDLFASRFIQSYYKGTPDNYRRSNNNGNFKISLILRHLLLCYCAYLPVSIQRVLISYLIIAIIWILSLIVLLMKNSFAIGITILLAAIIIVIVFICFIKWAILNISNNSNNRIMVETTSRNDYEVFIEQNNSSLKDNSNNIDILQLEKDSEIEIDIQLDEVDSLKSISLQSDPSSLANDQESNRYQVSKSDTSSSFSSLKSIQLSVDL